MKSETELHETFEFKDDPSHTRHLTLMLLSGIGIGFVCAVGIIFVWLKAELIDSIDPHIQLLIAMVFLGGYGILRLIVWLRNLS